MAKKKPKAKPATADGGKAKKDRVVPSPAKPVELEVGAGDMPRLSKYQKFTPRRVARRDIKGAEYNPRDIDKYARETLKQALQAKGLIASVTWNKRTGNLVGGHQRIEILDTLERTQDYSLDVDEVDMSPAEEMEANLLLNNPNAQGSYSLDKLVAMAKSNPDIDWSAAGFTDTDLQVYFGEDAPVAHNLFATDSAPEAVKEDLATLGAINAQKRATDLLDDEEAADPDEGDEELDAAPEEPAKVRQADETPEQRIERMRREKREYREQANERDDTEDFLYVQFRNRAAREEFLTAIGQDPNTRYLAPEILRAHLGLDEEAKAS